MLRRKYLDEANGNMSCLSELRYIIIIIILLQLITCEVYGYPIEVTGKNIKYYKLSPNEGSGSYNFDYGTKDGAQRSERGFVKHDPNSPEPLLVVTGRFKQPNANEVFYIADEQGYRIVSQEEINELHSQLSDEVFPTAAPLTRKSENNPGRKEGSSGGSSTSVSSRAPESYSSAGASPVTESQLITVNIIQPEKAVTCAPGKCSGARQSKIFQIKPLKVG